MPDVDYCDAKKNMPVAEGTFETFIPVLEVVVLPPEVREYELFAADTDMP